MRCNNTLKSNSFRTASCRLKKCWIFSTIGTCVVSLVDVFVTYEISVLYTTRHKKTWCSVNPCRNAEFWPSHHHDWWALWYRLVTNVYSICCPIINLCRVRYGFLRWLSHCQKWSRHVSCYYIRMYVKYSKCWQTVNCKQVLSVCRQYLKNTKPTSCFRDLKVRKV